MLVIKRGYRRRYAYGGSGLLDNLATIFTSYVTPSVIPFLKDTGQQIAKKQAVDIGNKLATKAVNKVVGTKKPNNRKQKNNEVEKIIEKYNQPSTSSIMEGSAIPIESLVRKLKI